jgi:hypothetical protein
MATYSGNAKPFVGAYNIGLQAPLDTRLVVDQKSNLLDRSDAAGALGKYTYVGMMVVVKNEGAIYILTAADSTVEANWAKIPTMGDISGIAGGMHFISVLPVVEGQDFAGALAAYKAEHTSYLETAGDIFIWGTKEYIYSGSAWQELGDEANVVVSLGGANGVITLLNGQSATGSVNLTMVNGQLQANLVMPVASDIAMTGYAKAQTAADVAANDTVSTAIGKIEKKMEENEETTSAALNDLNRRIIDLVIPVKYVTTISSDSGSHSATITAATHGCGTEPLVTVYYDGSQVIIDQSINANGDVTLAWAAGTTISAEHPLKVVILG